ncbi:MAG TPA: hypothetical protein VNP02_18360, partial [Gammaproteobacteria bacterium]|nr:hypothetical protein [Gammaproteobacteria bacterium]
MDAVATALTGIWGFLHTVFGSRAAGGDGPFWHFAIYSGFGLAKDYLWFLAGGLVIYGAFVRKRGERFSLWSGIRYLL